MHAHIPKERNNNDESIVPIFELTEIGKAFVEHSCEFCGAK